MKCEKCKKVCMESELINGYCYECRNKYKEESYSKNDGELSEVINKIAKENQNENLKYNITTENPTAKKLKLIINATWVLSIIFALISGIVLIIQEQVVTGIIIMIALPFSAWLSTVVLESFKEIITLLQDLKNK